MSKKPNPHKNPHKSVVYTHKPTGIKYIIFHTEGDEHVMEPISHRAIRVKKGDLENPEAWSKIP